MRPGYGKALEDRLEVLEDHFERMAGSVQQLWQTHQSQNASIVCPDVNAEGSDLARSHMAPELPEGQAEVSEAIHTNLTSQTWQSSQAHIHPQRPLACIPYTSPLDSEPLASVSDPLANPQTGQIVDTSLPSEDVLRVLVNLFFELMYPWLPLFCKPYFMANIFDPQREMLLHAIVVVAFRFYEGQDISTSMRDQFMKMSQDKILAAIMDTCTLVSTQALALLAVDSIGQGPGPRTWNIMSMLVAASRHLGLSRNLEGVAQDPDTPMIRFQDEEEELNLTYVGAEEKRRLFWVICGLDRLSSVSHGQAGGIDSKSIKTLYPANDDDWGQPASADWFQAASPANLTQIHSPTNLWHFYIDLLVFVDKSNELLIQPVNLSHLSQARDWQGEFKRLDLALSSWFENLPKEIRNAPSSFDPMWYTVHATFYLYVTLGTSTTLPANISAFKDHLTSLHGRSFPFDNVAISETLFICKRTMSSSCPQHGGTSYFCRPSRSSAPRADVCFCSMGSSKKHGDTLDHWPREYLWTRSTRLGTSA